MGEANTKPNDVPRVIVRTWRTATRYYSAVVQCNLFGQWELLRMWGGRGTRLGSSLVEPAPSFDVAMAMLEREARRRKARHYALTDEGGLH
jgi:predicted DNA-binding WGR domain protein